MELILESVNQFIIKTMLKVICPDRFASMVYLPSFDGNFIENIYLVINEIKKHIICLEEHKKIIYLAENFNGTVFGGFVRELVFWEKNVFNCTDLFHNINIVFPSKICVKHFVNCLKKQYSHTLMLNSSKTDDSIHINAENTLHFQEDELENALHLCQSIKFIVATKKNNIIVNITIHDGDMETFEIDADVNCLYMSHNGPALIDSFKQVLDEDDVLYNARNKIMVPLSNNIPITDLTYANLRLSMFQGKYTKGNHIWLPFNKSHHAINDIHVERFKIFEQKGWRIINCHCCNNSCPFEKPNQTKYFYVDKWCGNINHDYSVHGAHNCVRIDKLTIKTAKVLLSAYKYLVKHGYICRTNACEIENCVMSQDFLGSHSQNFKQIKNNIYHTIRYNELDSL